MRKKERNQVDYKEYMYRVYVTQLKGGHRRIWCLGVKVSR